MYKTLLNHGIKHRYKYPRIPSTGDSPPVPGSNGTRWVMAMRSSYWVLGKRKESSMKCAWIHNIGMTRQLNEAGRRNCWPFFWKTFDVFIFVLYFFWREKREHSWGWKLMKGRCFFCDKVGRLWTIAIFEIAGGRQVFTFGIHILAAELFN